MIWESKFTCLHRNGSSLYLLQSFLSLLFSLLLIYFFLRYENFCIIICVHFFSCSTFNKNCIFYLSICVVNLFVNDCKNNHGILNQIKIHKLIVIFYKKNNFFLRFYLNKCFLHLKINSIMTYLL